MGKFSLLLFLVLTVSGCNVVDTLSEGLKHSQEVADDLEKSVGEKPLVSFSLDNGSLTNVSVSFEGIPTRSTTEEVARLSRAAIRERFKQQPEQIVISYTLAGDGP